MPSRADRLYAAASRKLRLPDGYLREVLHYEPADIYPVKRIPDRLRVLTYDLNGGHSYVDWSVSTPPDDYRNWPTGDTKKNAYDLPALPFGMESLIIADATSRIPVCEGLTDWLVANFFRTWSSPTIGAAGLGSMVATVERLVAHGIEPSRIVLIADHDKPEKVGARQQLGGVIRTLRATYPAVSYLRPARVGWDIADGWRTYRAAWADTVNAAIEAIPAGASDSIVEPDAAPVVQIREVA
ncbi:MAG: hypothetical protein F4118_11330 [Acidimicrobiaceae bacterium]|nr:hypothetical protein [Acidimicrobiaceae bacterium]MYI36999.1 hypothetical protein [Acidimicrobiaceae bacterium]